jgi:Protein of unknown function (DUF229)
MGGCSWASSTGLRRGPRLVVVCLASFWIIFTFVRVLHHGGFPALAAQVNTKTADNTAFSIPALEVNTKKDNRGHHTVPGEDSTLARQLEFLVNQSILDECDLDGAPTCVPPAPFFPPFLPETPPSLPLKCAPRVSTVDEAGVLHLTPSVFCRGVAKASDLVRVTEIEPHRLHHKKKRRMEPLPANASFGSLRFDVRDAEYISVQCARHRTEFHTIAQVRRRGANGEADTKRVRGRTSDSLHLLALGLDSASRQQLRRYMPQTLNYLRSAHLQHGMTVFEFPLQNIVADGTTGNMLALLAGQPEISLPDSRRSNPNASFVDDYPWIWQPGMLASHYRTGFFEHPMMGMFSLRLKGFRRAPADHFMWPLYTAPGYGRDGAVECENLPESIDLSHRSALDHTRSLTQAYDAVGLRFAGVSFFKIAHGPYGHFAILDGDLLRWFAELAAAGATSMKGKLKGKGKPGQQQGTDGVLSRSAVFLFGDHGMRYGAYRGTPAGSTEERQPLAILLMPTAWLKRHPAAHAALRTNQRRLTTLYDFHATFLELGGVHSHAWDAKQSPKSVGRSLLRPIPTNRTCAGAQIPMHHCMCTKWREVNTLTSNALAIETVDASKGVVKEFNSRLALRPRGVICANLSLGVIEAFQMLAPDSGALQFVKTDGDGRRVARSSAEAEANFFLSELRRAQSVKFKVQFTTVPGNGRFEVHAILDPSTKKVAVTGEISRLNTYGEPCTGITAELRPLCYRGDA